MSYRNYLVRKSCKINAICGPVNLPYGTLVICKEGVLCTKDEKPLCYAGSHTAREYFSQNDDGMGAVRGYLVQSIIDALSISTHAPEDIERRNALWARVYQDPSCLKFKDSGHNDFWLWNEAFYDAEIEELKKINELVGGKCNV